MPPREAMGRPCRNCRPGSAGAARRRRNARKAMAASGDPSMLICSAVTASPITATCWTTSFLDGSRASSRAARSACNVAAERGSRREAERLSARSPEGLVTGNRRVPWGRILADLVASDVDGAEPVDLTVVDEQAPFPGHDDQLAQVERVAVRSVHQEGSGLGRDGFVSDERSREDSRISSAQGSERDPGRGPEPARASLQAPCGPPAP